MNKTKIFNFLGIPNKVIEFQIAKFNEFTTYFDINISWTREQDHAGFRFSFEVWKLYVGFQIYDTRHWDHVNNKWEKI